MQPRQHEKYKENGPKSDGSSSANPILHMPPSAKENVLNVRCVGPIEPFQRCSWETIQMLQTLQIACIVCPAIKGFNGDAQGTQTQKICHAEYFI